MRDILAELYGAPRPSIDTATAAASRKSLHRALEEFVREVFSGSEDETEAAAVQAAAGSMEVINTVFEAEARRPLNGLLRGQLPRAMLLQIQHLKARGRGAGAGWGEGAWR